MRSRLIVLLVLIAIGASAYAWYRRIAAADGPREPLFSPT